MDLERHAVCDVSRRPGVGAARRGSFRGVGGAVAASPASILSGALTGWWDDGSATMTGASWTNRTGGTAFTQGTGGLQPATGTAINGRPTLQTDGVDDRMDAASVATLYTTSAFCLWMVVRPLGVLIAGPPVGTATRCFATDVGGYTAAGCATDARGITFDTNYDITTTPGVMSTGTVYQIRLRLDAGTLYYRLRNSGGTVGEGSVVAGNLGGGGALRFGTDYLAANGQSFDVGAIVTANAAPSAGQLSAMDAWTFGKWGV